MGPLGVPELIFILILALLVFGPKRLPEIGRTLGRAMGEFRRATTDLKRTLNTEIAEAEERPAPRAVQPAPSIAPVPEPATPATGEGAAPAPEPTGPDGAEAGPEPAASAGAEPGPKPTASESAEPGPEPAEPEGPVPGTEPR